VNDTYSHWRIGNYELSYPLRNEPLTDYNAFSNANTEIPESSAAIHFIQRLEDTTQRKDSKTSDLSKLASITPITEMESNIPNKNVTNINSAPSEKHVVDKISAQEKMTKIQQTVFEQTNIVEELPKSDHNLVDEMITDQPHSSTVNVTVTKKANTYTKSAVQKNRKLRKSRTVSQLHTANFPTRTQEKISKQVRCKDCDYMTSHRGQMNWHKKNVHLKMKNNFCEECNYSTMSKQQLKRHIKSVHLKFKNYQCDKCNFSTRDQYNLTQHKKSIHVNVNDHKCKDCFYCTSNKVSLKKHVKKAHTVDKKAHQECSSKK